MCISFSYLMAYQRRLPYATKCIRQCGFSSALIVFLYFLFALLIKAKVAISPHDTAFYGAIIGILTCAIFSVPVFIVVRTARWSIVEVKEKEAASGGDGDEEDEDEEAGSAAAGDNSGRRDRKKGDDGDAEEAVSPALLKVLMLPGAALASAVSRRKGGGGGADDAATAAPESTAADGSSEAPAGAAPLQAPEAAA